MSTLIAGRQPVLEALKSQAPIEKIYLLYGAHGTAIRQLRLLAKQRSVPLVELDKSRFAEVGGDANAQGVIALASSAQYVDIEYLLRVARDRREPPFLVVLDEIEDPHNLGALIRSAEGAGAHGVVLPKHHSASITQTVIKTSAGAMLHLPLARVTNIVQTIETLKESGVWTVGLDVQGDRAYDEVDSSGPVAVVVGNEGKGIRRLVKERCDFLVRIPMYGKIGSLNASVAGALVLFHIARVRHRNDASSRQTSSNT
jgi:23S rRNA (guanosine2251-2'-O)-methyltransferase